MASPKPSKKIKPPKGTRDLYPEDLLRQRYITNAWRDASIRCGFEEIAGPTFESTELYSVKSGDGILNELFQAFSGKSDKEIEQVQATGTAPYALRPEFTPTLARMYAAHAKQLPKPCKWFTAGPYFRAERPQRGRLREFLQWNIDVIGLPSDEDTPDVRAQMDAEIIECCVLLLEELGFTPTDTRLGINDRIMVNQLLSETGVSALQMDAALSLLDKREKVSVESLKKMASEAGLIQADFISYLIRDKKVGPGSSVSFDPDKPKQSLVLKHKGAKGKSSQVLRVFTVLDSFGINDWCDYHPSIVRGLAYYTGTVFEAIADGERAVAGGGRYDNLIELFGGPPTPACGFGMGDVVLSNLLDDKELMPSGLELREAVARPQASIRPDCFIVPNGECDSKETNEPLVHTLTANLRRGIESETWLNCEDRKPWNNDRYAVAPLHARISYKSTRKINKLKADASDQHARFFVEIYADNKAELTNMDTRESIASPVGSWHVDPTNEHYIGRAIQQHM